jgi:DNA-binding CsgD family transcriptional regulator
MPLRGGKHPLSPREQEIVRLVADGFSNKQIGEVLDISPWTVSSHLRRLFAKRGVTSRAALVASVLEREQAELAVRSQRKA